jgi:hypothetical protein
VGADGGVGEGMITGVGVALRIAWQLISRIASRAMVIRTGYWERDIEVSIFVWRAEWKCDILIRL